MIIVNLFKINNICEYLIIKYSSKDEINKVIMGHSSIAKKSNRIFIFVSFITAMKGRIIKFLK